MKYNPPYGATDSNASYVNGTPTSKGSVIPAEAIEDPQREIVNAIIALGMTPAANDRTQLAKGLLAQSLEYSNAIDYDKPRIVIANDTLYMWKQTNGPSTVVINPADDTTGTYWAKYDPAPPESTSLTAGLVKLSDALDGTEDADTGKTAATPLAVKLVNDSIVDTLQEFNDVLVNLEVVLAEFQRQLIVESDIITRYQINTNNLLDKLATKISTISAGTIFIQTPSITSPASGTVLEAGNNLTLTGSTFTSVISADHHSSSWKICTDQIGNTPIAQYVSNENLTSITFPASDFDIVTESKSLYAFVRYRDPSLGYSFWSEPLEIVFDALEESGDESE